MPVSILPAVLTDVGEASAFFVFCSPCIVEAIFIAIYGFNRMQNAAGSSSLDDLALSRVRDIGDGTAQGVWMLETCCSRVVGVVIGVGVGVGVPILGCGKWKRGGFELAREIVLSTLCIGTYTRAHQRQDGIGAEGQLCRGVFGKRARAGRSEFCAKAMAQGTEGGVRSVAGCMSREDGWSGVAVTTNRTGA
jgi:hypothetical protein